MVRHESAAPTFSAQVRTMEPLTHYSSPPVCWCSANDRLVTGISGAEQQADAVGMRPFLSAHLTGIRLGLDGAGRDYGASNGRSLLYTRLACIARRAPLLYGAHDLRRDI